MSLPVFAINLDRSTKRWDDLKSAASEFGLDLRRVRAIDGASVSPENWTDVDFEGFAARNGRKILPGEYGCYRSHLLALETFLEDGAPYGLIIEDDVLPEALTADRVDAVLRAMPKFDVIKLVNHRHSLFMSEAPTSLNDEIGRTIHGPQGSAAAYLVSREGAGKLLKKLASMSLPWDVALERFWATDCEVFSVDQNLLGFSSERRKSLIASKAEYKAVKYTGVRRALAIWFRLGDYARRVHNVLLPPSSHNYNRDAGPQKQTATSIEIIASVALLLFLSTLWIESDVYRYAGVGMVLVALVYYLRKAFWTYDKPLIGPIGILCILWAFYVAARFGYDVSTKPGVGTGAAEGIYLLPLFYSTFGYALFLYVRHPFKVAATFIAISCAVLLIWTDYAAILQNVRPTNILHKNSIHASVAAGLIVLCSLSFGVYTLRREDLSRNWRIILFAIAAITFGIALVNLYALKSKGVWAAIAIALPLLALHISFSDKSRAARRIAIAGLLVASLGAGLVYDKIWKVGSATTVATSSLTADVATGGGLLASMEAAIADKSVPSSTKARFKLWVNSTHIWAEYPIFGAGIAWLRHWDHRKYKEPNYTLAHNGYLEIGMRYGIVGLLFYLTIFAWAIRRVWQASKAGLINPSAMQLYIASVVFFAITIMSNSNNRLAIGESFMWFAMGFAFYCYYLLQKRGDIRPRTYF